MPARRSAKAAPCSSAFAEGGSGSRDGPRDQASGPAWLAWPAQGLPLPIRVQARAACLAPGMSGVPPCATGLPMGLALLAGRHLALGTRGALVGLEAAVLWRVEHVAAGGLNLARWPGTPHLFSTDLGLGVADRRALGRCVASGLGMGHAPTAANASARSAKVTVAFMAGLLVCEYGQCVMADGTSRRDSCEASPSSDAGDLKNSGSAADKSHPAVPKRHSARTDATKAARTCRARVRFSRKPRDPVAQGELKPGCTKATMKRPPAWAVTTHGREQGGVHGTGRVLVHAGPQAQAGEERLARPGGPHRLRAHPRRAPGPCGPRRRRGWLRSAACRALVAAHTPCLPFVLHRPSRLSSHRFWTTWRWT